jgi:hypothetical protein
MRTARTFDGSEFLKGRIRGFGHDDPVCLAGVLPDSLSPIIAKSLRDFVMITRRAAKAVVNFDHIPKLINYISDEDSPVYSRFYRWHPRRPSPGSSRR